ncbi:MAG: hypothetical protein WHS82_04955 [Candidatus Methanosuratincola sp.]
MKEISYASIRGKKTLIRGEVGKGKTLLLSRLLAEAANAEEIGSITVIDMAPGEKDVGNRKVGGKLTTPPSRSLVGCIYAPGRVFAPRLEGRTAEEVTFLAMQNAKAIEPYLTGYVASPTPVLFVNDLTIYLQSGRPELLREAIGLAKTFVGTAYWGDFFDDRGSGINARERLLLERLADLFDIVVEL